MANDVSNIVQRTQGHFKFVNGDQYFGEYAVDMTNKSTFRHGCGTYVTARCCIYQGKWTFDKLKECAYIKYPNKQIFCGSLDSEGNYLNGTFDFEDTCRVCGEFEGTPKLKFQDLNDTFWNVKLVNQTLTLTNDGIK